MVLASPRRSEDLDETLIDETVCPLNEINGSDCVMKANWSFDETLREIDFEIQFEGERARGSLCAHGFDRRVLVWHGGFRRSACDFKGRGFGAL